MKKLSEFFNVKNFPFRIFATIIINITYNKIWKI